MVEPRSAAVPAPIRPHARFAGATGVLLAVLAVTVLASCSKASEQASEQASVTSDGYTIEPPGEVGPDAFTAPFTNDTSICDKQQFLQSLQSRPDAYREWARVLGVAPDDVPAYVETLTPIVLASDTKVTNHGLRDGKAYARKSLLQAGTAVLIDPRAGGTTKQFVSSTTTSTATSTTSTTRVTTTSTTSTPGTTPPADTPVTRCKCGNPLLPPGDLPPGTTSTTTPGTTVVTTSPPVSRRPPTTTTTGSSTTSSSTPPSSTTTTTPSSSTTTTPSSSTSRVIVTTTTTNAATPIRDVHLGFAARWLRAG